MYCMGRAGTRIFTGPGARVLEGGRPVRTRKSVKLIEREVIYGRMLA